MNRRPDARGIKKIGVFVAGGPAAGINSVIKGVVQAADHHGIRVMGYLDGARGLYENEFVHLTREKVENIDFLGGSILGLSRFDLRGRPSAPARIRGNLAACGVGGLVSIGGDGTLRLARDLQSQGIRIVHVPKTIDNDIAGVPRTFGFDTAVQEATRLLSTLKLDAEASDTWFVVEIMGRAAGFLAMEAGIASGASQTLIGEAGPIDVDAVARVIHSRRAAGLDWGVILVAEAAHFGRGPIRRRGRLGGVGESLGRRLEQKLNASKVTVRLRNMRIGYFLRCALPTGFDREYAARLGLAAAPLLLDGAAAGSMVFIEEDDLRRLPIADCAGEPRVVDTASARFQALQLLNEYAAAEQDVRERRALRQAMPQAIDWLRGNLSNATLNTLAQRLGLPIEALLEVIHDMQSEGKSS